MSFLVVVSFDIKNGISKDYDNLYNTFDKIGLKRSVKADDGKLYKIPTTTTVVGEFTGQTSAKVRDDVRELVKNSYRLNNLSGEFYINVGNNWTWTISSV
jgi:hypothetical protein